MTIGLTSRQADVMRYIQGYVLANGGVSPSFDEMCAGTGYARSQLGYLLDALVERGHINRLPRRARAIEILEPISIPRSPEGEPLCFVGDWV